MCLNSLLTSPLLHLQRDRQTSRQTDKQTDRNTGRETDRQVHQQHLFMRVVLTQVAVPADGTQLRPPLWHCGNIHHTHTHIHSDNGWSFPVYIQHITVLASLLSCLYTVYSWAHHTVFYNIGVCWVWCVCASMSVFESACMHACSF